MSCRAALIRTCGAGYFLTPRFDPREYARSSARLLYPHVCVEVHLTSRNCVTARLELEFDLWVLLTLGRLEQRRSMMAPHFVT